MTLCAKPLTEKCARPEGHGGECQCPHHDLAQSLRSALETLVRKTTSNKEFYIRKAGRVADAVLRRTAATAADFARDREEKQARLERRLAAHQHDPFTHRDLLVNLKAALPSLARLLDECSGMWGYEDPIYRLYHGSAKVYMIQEKTAQIVASLQALAPHRDLNDGFQQIVQNGTGRAFQWSDNARWLEMTRPMVEAFFHARYFLEMAVRYGQQIDDSARELPSGWAAFLCLYDLR
jgi:hypothetical protein